MKFLVILGLLAVASADVSHLLASNGYLPPRNQYLPPSLPDQGTYSIPPPSYQPPTKVITPEPAPVPTYGVPAQTSGPAIGITDAGAQFTGQFSSTGFATGSSSQYLAPAPTPTISSVSQQIFTPAVQPTYIPPVQQTYRQPYSYSQPIRPQPFVPAVQPTYFPPAPQTPTISIDVQPTYTGPITSQGSYSSPAPAPVTTPFATFSGPQTVNLIPEPAPAHSFGADGYHYRNPNQL
ncbi:unnamed protein product [Hermetia illucens]|uniref:Uncharacterized protein n=1 Tax=Hermetia illucens TaxID=343691 RepID=A0A7R8UIW1_HERIL|nr:extensin-like [Hermetia illucens]CAD7081641.1 unnamed protein product [Hermetia illucens]